MVTHRHKAVPELSQDSCYIGPVAKPGRENPAAHGNICRTEVCGCGAFRQVNVNYQAREAGPWKLLSLAEASR